MKKRLLALLLAVSIAFSVLVPAVSAASNNSAVQTAITLGAISSDQANNLSDLVTRGAFAKMLVCFSSYRESVASQGTVGTLYKDVQNTSQWAPYVRIAVQQGWLNGYTDGTFRPDSAVTLEEACTAVLKLLGYKMTDLAGAFPTAQLNKANEIGLRSYMDRKQGDQMTYDDITLLMYNALVANTANGGTYGTTLGFTVSNGQVDTSSVMMSSLSGPYVAGDNTQLPFTPQKVYRNDKTAESAELDKYDVYYYSESLQTVWIYTKRAAGRVSAVLPSASAPTSVTVAGKTYTLGTTAAASKVSSLNGGGVGEVVTLLLGMNNVVADVVTGEEADNVFYGVVTDSLRSLVEENGADVTQVVTVSCTDGVSRQVNVAKDLNFPKGWLVRIDVNSDGENVTAISSKNLSGSINESATSLGDYAFADDVEILDTTSEGVAGTVRPSRLSGVNLKSSDVRYYTLNDKGQIDRLILNDVTGDLWDYGVLDDIKTIATNASSVTEIVKKLAASGNSSGSSDSSGSSSDTAADSTVSTAAEVASSLRNILVPTTSEILWGVLDGSILSTVWSRLTSSTGQLTSLAFTQIGKLMGEPFETIFGFVGSGATYLCYVNGGYTAYATSIKYPVLAGGIAVRKEINGEVKAMVQLMPCRIDKLGAASAMSDGTRYEIADNTCVYLWYKGQYYVTSLTSVNSEDYKLIGWYDNFGCTAGKQIRVIVAVKND